MLEGMDVAAHLLILVGIGCLIMGFVLLSQPHELAREIKVESRDQETRKDPLKPVTNKTDRIWLQETRELSEPLRPFPTF